MRAIFIFWFFTFLFIGVPSQVSLAAPQILAVLASEDGISLTCANGICEADLSAFCLQRARHYMGEFDDHDAVERSGNFARHPHLPWKSGAFLSRKACRPTL